MIQGLEEWVQRELMYSIEQVNPAFSLSLRLDRFSS